VIGTAGIRSGMIADPHPNPGRQWQNFISRSLRLGLCCAVWWMVLLPADSAEAGAGMGGGSVAAIRSRIEDSLRLEAHAALRRSCRQLQTWQLPDGSWAEHPAITSLAVLALLNARPWAAAESQRYDAALDFICRKITRDGMSLTRLEQAYPVFTTAVSMFALIRAGRPGDQSAIRNAREFLLSSQFISIPDTDSRFGGFCREPQAAPDLTTTEYVLEALYLSDFLNRPPLMTDEKAGQFADAAYVRAAAFIGRCQIPVTAVEMSGGFLNGPPPASEPAMVGPTHSPGYLLCAGLKSLLYANVSICDPRVTAAVTRLNQIYTVEKNPGAGAAGYYTYLYTLTKALTAWERQTPAASTVSPPADWRRQVTEALLVRQLGDGSWRQQNPDGWENRTELTTAYALLTLELILDEGATGPVHRQPASIIIP